MPATDSPAPASERPRTGLTLSGGGFRATLFHLGVVRFLYEEKLLHKVTHVCSVSGGSILAAHLVLNWARYTSPKEEEFNEVARELVAFIRRDVRGRVVRPWLVSWLAVFPRFVGRRAWWRTALLQRQYDRLYRGATMQDLTLPDSPDLHLLSTSFTTGHLVAFGKNKMQLVDDPAKVRTLPKPRQAETAGGAVTAVGDAPGRGGHPDEIDAPNVPVALAVAASSAFPPLFPPVRVDAATFGAVSDEWPQPHYLTDGGVFDNLGIRRFLWLFEPEERLDMIVVSDAQRSLTREFSNEYNFAIGRTSRCVDLMMNRVSWFENAAAQAAIEKSHGKVLACRMMSPVDERHPYAPLSVHQDAVRTARTDLDDFTPDEIDAIVHHGYAVARAAAEADGSAAERPPGHTVWTPARRERPPRGGYALRGIARRRWGMFRANHWASWALVGLVAFWLLLPVGIIAVQSVRAKVAEQQVTVADAKNQDLVRATELLSTVRLLAEVALADDKSDYELRKQEWEKYRAGLVSDPWFREKFETDPDLLAAEAAIRSFPFPNPEVGKQSVLRVAKKTRGWIASLGGSKDFDLILTGDRPRWYNEAIEVTRTISQKSRQLSDLPNSRKRFWRLYWADLPLVEGSQVEEAMVTFGNLLSEWERTGKDATPEMKDRLRGAADQLKVASRTELDAK